VPWSRLPLQALAQSVLQRLSEVQAMAKVTIRFRERESLIFNTPHATKIPPVAWKIELKPIVPGSLD
jgi:hypothetical protein